ncbi:hypothetical protein CEX98_17545 [Pseudoalteromonas piscicida]|uniref:Uncharacterized protein n=1 Tax=Pseudoalteromonas piscicida TaxID=43662 RepID=A0A2A5JM70_PSEO7|nr:hypothetical protein CEX98_17545 [Pseudoalteromonas piscicida]
MRSDNFVLITAKQLAGKKAIKPWMFKIGLALLNSHITERKNLGLPLFELEQELAEAKRELENL